MKQSTILTAQTLGYFRAKSAEKRQKIFDELVLLEEFADVDTLAISSILEAEIKRRSDVYHQKQKKALQKVEADASKPLTGGTDDVRSHITGLDPGKYVLTVAQNNTDVDQVFFNALQKYCEINDAKLLIAKMTYNKSGFLPALDAHDGIYYDPKVIPFLVENQIRLGGDVEFVAQANVSPTAHNPLTGFAGMTKPGCSVVIPASKIAMQCTAGLNKKLGKRLFSTGAITKPNYILRKAGAVAASGHNIGALFVDTTVSPHVIRQLEKMPGSSGFYDENRYYDCDGYVVDYAYPDVLQFGDIHAEKMTGENQEKIGLLIEKYRPVHVILHDVCDFSSRNHHNVKDASFIFKQTIQGNTVESDIKAVSAIIDFIALGNKHIPLVHIIESNHDLAINTWLKNSDFKDDPVNALTYLKCVTALYQHIEKTGNSDFNMLEYAYKHIGHGASNGVKFHTMDESVMIAGVEHGVHGHTGLNGAKGSPTSFRTLGVPMNTGHTHTPSIVGQVYTAGVSACLDMGYNVGPSSWALAHVLTYPNGQRQIIFM